MGSDREGPPPPDYGSGEKFELNVYRQCILWKALLIHRGCNPADGQSFISPASWSLKMPWERNDVAEAGNAPDKHIVPITLTGWGVIGALLSGYYPPANKPLLKTWIDGHIAKTWYAFSFGEAKNLTIDDLMAPDGPLRGFFLGREAWVADLRIGLTALRDFGHISDEEFEQMHDSLGNPTFNVLETPLVDDSIFREAHRLTVLMGLRSAEPTPREIYQRADEERTLHSEQTRLALARAAVRTQSNQGSKDPISDAIARYTESLSIRKILFDRMPSLGDPLNFDPYYQYLSTVLGALKQFRRQLEEDLR